MRPPLTVRELLSSPDSWTQGVFARDQNGKSVCPDDPSATCWCLMGAILYIFKRENMATYKHVLDVCLNKINPLPTKGEWSVRSMIDWNDSPERSHEDVVELLENTGI